LSTRALSFDTHESAVLLLRPFSFDECWDRAQQGLCSGWGDPCPTPTATPDEPALACRNSGGVSSVSLCCNGVGDFPDTCAVGACGCAPSASHEVNICRCGTDRCFDGMRCVRRDVATRTPTPTLNPLTPTPTPTVDDSGLYCIATGGTPSIAPCCLGARDYPEMWKSALRVPARRSHDVSL
jgi:hypothetical protein